MKRHQHVTGDKVNQIAALILIRTHLGLSQSALARRIGIKPPMISYIETGRRTASPATIARIEAALDVKLSDPRIMQAITLLEQTTAERSTTNGKG
jgi:transcriptional regulator with XRE-family HTH domain